MRGKPLERKRCFFFSFLHLTAEQAGKKKRMLELTDHDVLCCSSAGWDNKKKLYLHFALE